MQSHNLNDKQVNFLKKLYFLFGQTTIPFLGDIDLGDEYHEGELEYLKKIYIYYGMKFPNMVMVQFILGDFPTNDPIPWNQYLQYNIAISLGYGKEFNEFTEEFIEYLDILN